MSACLSTRVKYLKYLCSLQPHMELERELNRDRKRETAKIQRHELLQYVGVADSRAWVARPMEPYPVGKLKQRHSISPCRPTFACLNLMKALVLSL